MKITENDIRAMVSESVRRVVNEISGYVKPDGNGMTGGYWGGSKYTNSIDFDPREYIEDIEISDEDYDVIDAGLKDDYSATLTIDSSYDETTGYGSKYNPVVSIEDYKIDDSFYNDVNNLSIEDGLKQQIIDAVEEGMEDYEFDSDNDYYDDGPDPDDYYEERRDRGL